MGPTFPAVLGKSAHCSESHNPVWERGSESQAGSFAYYPWMSNFDDSVAKAGRRVSRFGIFILIVVLVLVFVLSCVGPYTEWLWFKEDARHPVVFSKILEVKGYLFLGGFIVSLLVLYTSLSRALSLSMVHLERPSSVSEVLVSRFLGVLQEHGGTITKIVSCVIALMFGGGLTSLWDSYLLWAHAQPFHRVDPIFGRDLGFYVFQLPFWLSAITFVFTLFVVVTVLTTAIYLSLGSVAAVAKVQLARPAIRGHVGLLFGLSVAIYGVQLWMRRFEYGVLESGQFIGAGYAAMHQLPVQTVLAFLIVATGLLGAILSLTGARLSLAYFGLGACALVYVGGMVIYPGLLQVTVVNPNKLTAESPYASKAINQTRFAYGLDQIDVKNSTVQAEPSAADLTASQSTLDNMRLWDPTELRRSAEALQGLKPYYEFRDVDLDRYRIGGHQQMVMLAPRDINVAGLSPSAQNWVNMKLQYTHGFGVTVSPVNEATSEGEPMFLVRDIPPVAPPELKIDQPRIYFSDFGENQDNYVLVDTKVDEFDYPAESIDQHTRWTGNRGVEVGALFPRIAYSIVLGDFSLLISPNVTSNSRLLVHRGILDRAHQIYPFLTFDNDPYMVILNGRLVWVLDGYTGTDRMPYSAYSDVDGWRVNYMRNPVKVMVDAYSGEMTAFAIDPNEPLLRAWESIFPGLVRPASEMPAGLADHFRYPGQLFTAQAQQLTLYHVPEQDPVAFLNNEDAWDMPTERGLSGDEESMSPYYVQMRLPDEGQDEFMLILPFTPRQKGNMSGWLAAHCDPADYGKLRLYEYPRGSILPGPKQMEANFNQSPQIANQNTLLKNANSQVLPGNLLVMPIGHSVMYVEPMFLESTSSGITAIPELKKVVLALQDKIVIADTYADAMRQLFGNVAATPAAPATPPKPGTTPGSVPAVSGSVAKADVQEALKLANDADAALRAGDFAKYGDLQKQLKAKLQQLVGK